jgi:hypothetical protein
MYKHNNNNNKKLMPDRLGPERLEILFLYMFSLLLVNQFDNLNV